MSGKFHAAQAVEVVERRGQTVLAEGKIAERGISAVAARQFDSADASGAIEHHQRFQDVIDLIELDVEAKCGGAVDVGTVFDIADAAGGEHDAGECEVGGICGEAEGQARSRRHGNTHLF